MRRTTGLSPEVRQPIEAGLAGAVNDPSGTAYATFRDYQGVQVIGKTGTAQRPPKQDTSWFVGITNPANDPLFGQYVVVAMVEQGGFGATVAAPIVRRVIDYLDAPGQVPPPVVGRARGRQRGEQLMSTISPSRIARAQSRRGLGERVAPRVIAAASLRLAARRVGVRHHRARPADDLLDDPPPHPR